MVGVSLKRRMNLLEPKSARDRLIFALDVDRPTHFIRRKQLEGTPVKCLDALVDCLTREFV